MDVQQVFSVPLLAIGRELAEVARLHLRLDRGRCVTGKRIFPGSQSRGGLHVCFRTACAAAGASSASQAVCTGSLPKEGPQLPLVWKGLSLHLELEVATLVDLVSDSSASVLV